MHGPLIGALALGALACLAGAWWWATPTATDRSLLTPTPLRRAVRAYRSVVLRALTIPIGWPHLVDLAFGAGNAEERTPGDVVWQSGATTLTHFRGRATHAEPVLVIHSLVTDASILDLTPERSLVRHLRDHGFAVYLLDWGAPSGATASDGLAEYGTTLRAAERAVLEHSGSERLHEVAYCLSSTLVLVDLSSHPRAEVASVALLAPLADFAVPGGLRPLLSWRHLRPVLLLDAGSCVPAAVVRESFHALRPQAIAALRLRIARRHDEEYRDFYAAFARWAWRQHRLPGGLFFDLVDLYRGNRLFATEHSASGLAAITQPMLVAIAERDHLVPSGASHVLTTVPGLTPTVVNVASGHVSMIVGSAAKATMWPALVDFLTQHQLTRRKPAASRRRPCS